MPIAFWANHYNVYVMYIYTYEATVDSWSCSRRVDFIWEGVGKFANVQLANKWVPYMEEAQDILSLCTTKDCFSGFDPVYMFITWYRRLWKESANQLNMQYKDKRNEAKVWIILLGFAIGNFIHTGTL